VPTKGVIGQETAHLNRSVPSRVVPLGPGIWRKIFSGVIRRQLRPAGRFPQRPPARPIAVQEYRPPGCLNRDDNRIPAVGPFQKHRSADRIDERRMLFEPGRRAGIALSDSVLK